MPNQPGTRIWRLLAGCQKSAQNGFGPAHFRYNTGCTSPGSVIQEATTTGLVFSAFLLPCLQTTKLSSRTVKTVLCRQRHKRESVRRHNVAAAGTGRGTLGHSSGANLHSSLCGDVELGSNRGCGVVLGRPLLTLPPYSIDLQ